MISAIIASRDGIARLLVAAERILDDVDEAAVAVGARPSARSWPRRNTSTRSLFATSGRAMLTASQSPRSIAAAMTDAVWKPPVQITGTVTAALIAPRVGQVRALRSRPARAPRLFHCWRASVRRRAEQQVVAERPLAARDHRVVGLHQILDRQVAAGRIARVREEAAGRDVNGVDAGLDQPLADLHRFVQRVARRADAEERDARRSAPATLIFICRWKSLPTVARIARTMSSTKRARFSSGPPYSSLRSLIAELRNCVIR